MNAMPSSTARTLRPFAVALVALALAIGGGWGWTQWRSSAAPGAGEHVFATVQRGDIEDLVGATGALQPRDFVDVGAQVSGQLRKLHVDVGSVVKEGELLAEIDAEQSAARVEANRASLRAQQATLGERQINLEKAERDLQRQRNLMAEQATTAEQLQNAETAVRAATSQIATLRAQIQQQQASMRVEEANLKFTRIYAPMSGTVISISARQGQTLNANQSAPTLLRIADLSTMTVQTQVSEADVGKLSAGMASYFTTLGSPGRRFHGALRRIEPTPTVTNNVVLYNALFDVPNPDHVLLPQMTAQVFFVAAAAHDVLVVPVSALTLQRAAARAPVAAPAHAIAAAGDAPAALRTEAGAPTAQRSGAVPPSTVERIAARPPGSARRGRPDVATADAPRRATVRVASSDGTLAEREVTVGVSNRVSAEVLSGLVEGERVVVGARVAEAPARRASGNAPLAPAGGALGGAGGGRR